MDLLCCVIAFIVINKMLWSLTRACAQLCNIMSFAIVLCKRFVCANLLFAICYARHELVRLFVKPNMVGYFVARAILAFITYVS